MISHHHECIFVHIPKNAGQSIEQVFLDLLGLQWETRAPLLLRPNDRPELGPPKLAHLKADEYVRFKYLTQEMFDEYFKFAFVRNPWSRAVSIYKYFGYGMKSDFKSFLLGDFKNKIFEEMQWFVGPQSDFIYANDGRLLVDYVGRFEELQDSFDFVCKRIDLPSIKLPHVNESKNSTDILSSNPKKTIRDLLCGHKTIRIPHYEKWWDYYDKESIDCVSRLYEKDIELLGYNFE